METNTEKTYYRATCDEFDDAYGEFCDNGDAAIESFWVCNTFSDREKNRVRVYCELHTEAHKAEIESENL